MIWMALIIILVVSAPLLQGQPHNPNRVRRTDEDAKKCQLAVRNQIAGIKINPITQELTFEEGQS
jgi:hypothetical protein